MFSFFTPARAAETPDVYGIHFRTIDGADLPLSSYKGKVILVVNVASRCGFTPQYAGLETLYETYKDKGLVILGVPSNDFGGQEPGSEADIRKFAESKFNVTFPLTSKEVVSGNSAHPFFKKVKSDLGFFSTPKWNFFKYLISRDGHLVAWYSSATKPDSDKLRSAIEAELAKAP